MAIDRFLGARLLQIAAAACLLNVLMIAIPGYFSHDELNWIHRTQTGDNGWGFGLANLHDSPFYRALGAPMISAVLRSPLQPFSSHAALVLLQAFNSCLLYLLVNWFRPDRAAASAILFAVMPGAAFAIGWVAAFFDMQFTFFALCFINASIAFWRRGYWTWAIVAIVSFAAGLACKEPELVIPLGVAVLAYCDRANLDRRRTVFLASATAGVALIYALLRLPALFHLGTTGEGGYGFGHLTVIGINILSYFGFPFASEMTEIGSYTEQQYLYDILVQLALHTILLILLWVRYNKTAPLFYLFGYFLPLLPVLVISKHETQYIYASSVALSVALALIWKPRPIYALLTIALIGVLLLHTLLIQQTMYVTGVCQTRALDTAAAIVPFLPSSPDPVVYGSDDTPWWVIARMLNQNAIHVGGRDINLTFSHTPDGAPLKFTQDCSVVPINKP